MDYSFSGSWTEEQKEQYIKENVEKFQLKEDSLAEMFLLFKAVTEKIYQEIPKVKSKMPLRVFRLICASSLFQTYGSDVPDIIPFEESARAVMEAVRKKEQDES